jgi:acetyltransferase
MPTTVTTTGRNLIVRTDIRDQDGRMLDVRIRPISPLDALLMQQLFDTLSPRSVYYRFLRPMTSLSPELLARFTLPDDETERAFVALSTWEEPHRMLRVARLFGPPGADRGEFSVLVGDPWQGQGVGAALLEQIIRISRERRIGILWGLVLPENRRMIALGRRFGCRVRQQPGEPELTLELTLDANPKR